MARSVYAVVSNSPRRDGWPMEELEIFALYWERELAERDVARLPLYVVELRVWEMDDSGEAG